MKISIDIQPAITQRAGVGRYTKQLVQHIGSCAEGHEIQLTYFDFTRKAMPFKADNTRQKAVRFCPGRAAQLLWKTINWPPYNAFAGTADIYHFPNFIIPPLSYGKSIVTIHDMSFIRHPSFAEEENLHYLSEKINDTACRADAIITDSRFSAGEICSLLDVNEDKVFPIHLGIDQARSIPEPAEVASALHSLKIDRPYILTVGTLEPRKNIPFLVEVFEKLTDFNGTLVIAGGTGWKYEPILERIRQSPCSSRIKYLKYVDDETLTALYTGAKLFMTTSVYEGFGLPPLEAMACGTPVVSSAGGSLPEVLGSAAKVISGFKVFQWREEVQSLLADEDALEKMSGEGVEHVRQYNWDRTARETWEVYRSLAT